MTFLLDTCVLSELVKPRPNPTVCDWVAIQEEHRLFLSVITIGEVQKGIAKLPSGQRRDDLQQWLDRDLLLRFDGRILPIDTAVAEVWGTILAEADRRGRPVLAIDALIAATAKAHGCTVVTRNEAGIEPTGVSVLNPWTSE